MISETLSIPRDLVTKNMLNCTELSTYLSAANLCGAYDRVIPLDDTDIMYNLTGCVKDFKKTKKRKAVNEAMERLMSIGVISAERIAQGKYLVNCHDSFFVDVAKEKFGYVLIDFNNIRKIVRGCTDDRQWQGMVLYYFELICHVRKDEGCQYSLQYFSQYVGVSELTLSKYNAALKDMGLIRIHRNFKTSSTYYIT